MDGSWKLVYSTISILGAKRTKLGLRDFIALGDFFQRIDVANVRLRQFHLSSMMVDTEFKFLNLLQERAFNVVKSSVRGFKMLNGQLTIEASYNITSKTVRSLSLSLSLSLTTKYINFTYAANRGLTSS